MIRLPSGHRTVHMFDFDITPWRLPVAHQVRGLGPFQLRQRRSSHSFFGGVDLSGPSPSSSDLLSVPSRARSRSPMVYTDFIIHFNDGNEHVIESQPGWRAGPLPGPGSDQCDLRPPFLWSNGEGSAQGWVTQHSDLPADHTWSLPSCVAEPPLLRRPSSACDAAATEGSSMGSRSWAPWLRVRCRTTFRAASRTVVLIVARTSGVITVAFGANMYCISK